MNIYAESSAILAWLLGEKTGPTIRDVLRGAELIMASDLTLLECDRVLIRAIALGEIDEATASGRRAYLNAAATHWHLWRISTETVDRARRSFPGEPIRTLDAIHLASALAAISIIPEISFLSLDDRLRAAAKQLGFPLLPR